MAKSRVSFWHKMWPDSSVNEVPITSLTNGVHPATWVAPLLRRVYEEGVGQDWIERSRDAGAWRYGIEKVSDRDLWQAHSLLKQRLVAFVRDISFDARLARGESEEHIEAARTMFDPEHSHHRICPARSGLQALGSDSE